MNLRCYIIDNEEYAIDLLSKHINNTPGLELVGSDTNPLEALRKISNGEIKADITFLDIEMPQLSGLDLASLIQGYTHIVFTTAHEHFALKAFETDVMDYLLKPIPYQRFLKGISKVQKNITGDHPNVEPVKDFVFIQSEAKGKLIKIKINDILTVESALNYVRIKLEKQTYLTYLTLKEMEGILPSSLFMRVHRTFLVNLDKVAVVEGGMIHLTDDTAIALGQSYKKDFLDRINEHLLKSKRQS